MWNWNLSKKFWTAVFSRIDAIRQQHAYYFLSLYERPLHSIWFFRIWKLTTISDPARHEEIDHFRILPKLSGMKIDTPCKQLCNISSIGSCKQFFFCVKVAQKSRRIVLLRNRTSKGSKSQPIRLKVVWVVNWVVEFDSDGLNVVHLR